MTTYLQIPEGGGGGVESVAALADLPAIGGVGDIYLLLDSGRLMWWDSVAAGWDEIDTDVWSGSVTETNSTKLTVTSGQLSSDLKVSVTVAQAGYTKATTTVKAGVGTAQGLHVEMQNGSTSVVGPVQMTDTYAGTSSTLAATQKCVNDGLATKQPIDADLTAIAAFAVPGIACKTSTDPAAVTWAQRTITGTANRLGVTNGDGAVGNPTLNVDTSLLPSPIAASVNKVLVATGADAAAWDILPRYTTTFNATTDWGSASAGLYTITIAVATHIKGTSPLVQVYETVGGANLVASATKISIAADGAVSLIVSETPDGRHVGKIVIM